MKAVIDPLPLTAIFQQPARTQLCKVSGDFWLVIVERPDQLADTEFTLSSEHEHDPGTGYVTETFEEGVGLNRHG